MIIQLSTDWQLIGDKEVGLWHTLRWLERDSLTLIDWFTENQMKANPDKFKAIAIGKKPKNKNISFNLNGNIIKCEDEIKLLILMVI